MRIAIVHSAYATGSPSGENIVVEMQTAALRRAGHHVLSISISTDDVVSSPGYVYRTGINVATGLGADPTAILHEFKPDVVHIHNLFPNFGTRWMRSWSGPVVCTIHNFRSVCAAATLYREGSGCTLCPDKGQHHAVVHACYKGSRVATVPLAIRNRGGVNRDPMLTRSDGIIFLSSRAQEQYKDFGLNTSNSYVLPNFVDAAPSLTLQEPSSSWLYLGRMTSEKGIEQLLSVWPTHVPLKIFGDGPDSERVKAKCSGMITYHGLSPRETVLAELKKAAGLVVPSTWAEGLPTTYLEALAAGVPVLAKVGNSAADDVAASGVGGVFGDWSEVPDAIARIEASREIYSSRASLRYSAAFSEEIWLAKIGRVYSESIERYYFARDEVRGI